MQPADPNIGSGWRTWHPTLVAPGASTIITNNKAVADDNIGGKFASRVATSAAVERIASFMCCSASVEKGRSCLGSAVMVKPTTSCNQNVRYRSLFSHPAIVAC